MNLTSERIGYVGEYKFEGEGMLVNVTVEMRHRWQS